VIRVECDISFSPWINFCEAIPQRSYFISCASYFHYGTFVLEVFHLHSLNSILQHQNNKEQKFSFYFFKEIKTTSILQTLLLCLRKSRIWISESYFWLIIAFFWLPEFYVPVSPPTTTNFSAQGIDITVVNYSQPSKKGRLIFWQMEASGLLCSHTRTYWRLGLQCCYGDHFQQGLLILQGQASRPQEPTGMYRSNQVRLHVEITLNSELGVFLGVQEPTTRKDVVKK